MGRAKPLTYTIRVCTTPNPQSDDDFKPWDSFTEEQKEAIRIKLNDTALRAVGYVRVDETA